MKAIRILVILLCVLSNAILLSEEEHVRTLDSEQVLSPPPPANQHPEYYFPPEELIERPTEPTNKFLSDFLNMLATLGLIIALIFIIAWFLKRFTNTRLEQANVTSNIKIIEKRVLSPKSVLYLLEVEGTGYLISESVNGVSHLSEFPLIKEKDTTEPKT